MHDNRDRKLAAVANRQRGLVTLEQLRRIGFDKDAIARRVRGGRLHRLHRGVYAVGHTHMDARTRRLAAVLACGPGAVLSHRSAAVEWELLGTGAALVDMTVASYSGRRAPQGIHLHRTVTFSDGDRTVRAGVPVTSPERTIEDLAGELSPRRLHVLVGRAERANLIRRDIRDVARPGAAALRSALARDPAETDTALELRFMALIKRHRIAVPDPQQSIGPYTVDFLWPAHRLVVETDSYEHHRDRRTFTSDRRRDADLSVWGYHVVRFTWWQITEEPLYVAQTLRALLSRPPVV